MTPSTTETAGELVAEGNRWAGEEWVDEANPLLTEWISIASKTLAAQQHEIEGLNARLANSTGAHNQLVAWVKQVEAALTIERAKAEALEKERDGLKANWVPGTTWTDEIRAAVDELEDRFDIELYDEEHFRRVLKFMEDAIAKARKAEAEVAALKAQYETARGELGKIAGYRNKGMCAAAMVDRLRTWAIDALDARTQAEGEG